MTNFDLRDELIAAGFGMTAEAGLGGYIKQTYSKTWSKVLDVVWYGEQECKLAVDVVITYYNGKPVNVDALYSYGKQKEHAYGKRAYNAIRDTVENNGYSFYENV